MPALKVKRFPFNEADSACAATVCLKSYAGVGTGKSKAKFWAATLNA